MKNEFYDFLFQLRSSGFYHNTPESMQQINAGAGTAGASHSMQLLDGERGSLSSSSFRDIRNFLIGTCFVSAQYLIEKGVDAEYAFGISDYYINRLDQISDVHSAQKLFREFLEEAEKMEAWKRPKSAHPLIDKCIHYIDQRLYTKLGAADVAAALGLNASYLSSLFCSHTGIPLHRYILNRKLEESKAMLRHTNRSVNEISDALCFSNPPHFCSLFKKYTGFTPKAYRDSPRQ